MAIDFGQVISGHAQALTLRGQRAEIIAANLANVNTPGYQARDIDSKSARGQAIGPPQAGASAMVRTSTRHMGAGGTQAEAAADAPLVCDALMYRVPHHASGDANTVELGVEQAAFAQNATGFQTSLTFLQMKLKGLAQAIQGQ